MFGYTFLRPCEYKHTIVRKSISNRPLPPETPLLLLYPDLIKLYMLLAKKNVMLAKQNVLLAKKNVLLAKNNVLLAKNKGPS